MKLLSFRVNGQESWGALTEAGIVDLGKVSGYALLRVALEHNALPELPAMIEQAGDALRLEDVELLPVVPHPPKIFCIGTNYHDHRIETGREVPEKPVVFARFANSQVAHGQPIIRPRVSEQLDFEGEIAIIIAKRGRNIAEADAWEYVAGYAPYNDGTIRDWQRHTHQWIPGKNFVATGGFGPWMVTRDEIADGADISLVTRLNGQEVQRTSAHLMIFSIPQLIAYCSTFTELEPGDVIVTGTPGGVGGKRNPPLWMKSGDTVEVEVGGVGTLSNPIIDEKA
ncbi:fumarylacetoacetate hydrolase family protein [Pseudomonas sp. GCM10022188]|uniref:fumarylacetoacetate hydrolase family protein n=1 Tax=Pseudomonas TaxID=286 RepID=UPI001E46BC47|nr:fumarylacetoacetate hydrolase family protein [Pseudomonas oryzagri]MCC6076064.1 fumarylacetoacetate hydrolase family protein [Pseudomonas oryzagri]